MKRFLRIYILLLSVAGMLTVKAQVPFNPMNPNGSMRDQYGNQIDPSTQPDNLEDSTQTDIQSLPPKLFMWQLEETLGERTRVPADTLTLDFQNTNLTEGMMGHYNYLGNLGAPRLSRIFRDRPAQTSDFFLSPYSAFWFPPAGQKFTNSNVPYTNLTYYKAGSRINGEDRFKSYFSVNAGKRLAFGFNIDYLYGRGYYADQATSHFNAGFFGSYIGEQYQMQMVYNHFYLKMNENGGITDDRYITRPEEMEDVGGNQYIPTLLTNTSNRNKNFHFYLAHRYRLGFYRETTRIEETQDPVARRRAERDSTDIPRDTLVVDEFVPVTSFIHTIKVERTRHRFRANSEGEELSSLYDNTYLQEGYSNDTTSALRVKNVLGIALLEGFNKYAKAGLTAYISHQFSRYTLMNMNPSTPRPVTYDEHELYVGGELSKKQGRLLHYNVNGEIGLAGQAVGQFKVKGQVDLNFRLGRDTVSLYARGHISNLLPDFYMRHYHSNHFAWDNNLGKELRTGFEGELNIERWGTNLRAGLVNLKNYTYFDQRALPAQYSGSIQVLSAALSQRFKVGIFHLDNEVTWQQTSNATLLPLPQLSLYHNFYLMGKLVKVLTVQLGAELNYFTTYRAPAYMPAIQQFHLQPDDDAVDIGGYPIVNAYLNLHLKRTRIFVMMYHVNAGMGNRRSFLVPHYPINSRLLKIGISWNFYD